MARGILFEDHEVDLLRSVLGATYSYLHAQDLVDSQRMCLNEVKESRLALEVKAVLADIEAKQGRRELQRRDGVEVEYPEDDEGNYLDDPDEEDDDDEDDEDE